MNEMLFYRLHLIKVTNPWMLLMGTGELELKATTYIENTHIHRKSESVRGWKNEREKRVWLIRQAANPYYGLIHKKLTWTFPINWHSLGLIVFFLSSSLHFTFSLSLSLYHWVLSESKCATYQFTLLAFFTFFFSFFSLNFTFSYLFSCSLQLEQRVNQFFTLSKYESPQCNHLLNRFTTQWEVDCLFFFFFLLFFLFLFLYFYYYHLTDAKLVRLLFQRQKQEKGGNRRER